MIKPTIGRQVWFRGIPWTTATHADKTPLRMDANQAMAATIVYVHSDLYVNLDVIDHAGVHWPVPSVRLFQGGEEPGGAAYAEWMPYQLAKPDAFSSMLFDGLARGTSWPELPNNISMSETLAGTGQLSPRALQ